MLKPLYIADASKTAVGSIVLSENRAVWIQIARDINPAKNDRHGTEVGCIAQPLTEHQAIFFILNGAFDDDERRNLTNSAFIGGISVSSIFRMIPGWWQQKLK